MRLLRLELKAFGPFTGKLLDFSGPLPGLHVVFGRNEAGKSSSLRGLKALLYGFDERTRDNFLHPNEQLLVAGRLCSDDGRELYFQRRKKRKADLLDAQGEPLDPGQLSAFLHGIEPSVFDVLFGIDHDSLVSGGQDILEQKGDLGRSLFAAGTGIAGLRRVLSDLYEESENLYKARGSKPQINQALTEYRELQKIQRDATLSGSEWKRHQQSLQEAQRALEALREEQRRCEAQRRHWERLRQALPYLAQHQALVAQRAARDYVAVLPEDFGALRRRAQEQQRALQQHLRSARERLADLEGRAAELQPSQALLDQAESVEALARRLGEYRKGLQDRPGLDGRRRQLNSEAAALLRQIRPDLPLEQIESLRPLLARRKTIHQLGARAEALEQSCRLADRQERQAEDELAQCRELVARISSSPPFDTLQDCLHRAQQAGDLDTEIHERRRVLERDAQSLAAELKRLGLWCGAWAELPAVSLPSAESLSREEERLRRLHEEQDLLRQRRRELQEEILDTQSEKQTLEAGGEPPTEQELVQIRADRDQGWQLLRRKWLHGEDVSAAAHNYDPEHALPDAFEQRMGRADLTADRLRSQADRVHQYAALRRRMDELSARLNRIGAQEEELCQALQSFEQHWQTLWAPSAINPRSPREMILWRAGMDALRLRVEAWQRATAEHEARCEQRAHLRQGLLHELSRIGEVEAFVGEELATVVSHAYQVVRRLEQQARERRAFEERISRLEESLRRARSEGAEAKNAQEAWRAQWRGVLNDLGLPGNALPAEVEDFLDSLQKCFEHLRQAQDFHKRIEGIDRDVRDYAAAVAALQGQIAPELSGLPADQAVVQMQALTNRAREQRSRLRQIEEDRRQVEDDLRQATVDLSGVEDELARLCRLARCDREEDLEHAEQRWREQQHLRERLGEVEERLLQIGEGLSLAELQAQAAQVGADEVPQRMAALSLELQERIDPEISRLNQRIGAARTELQRMDGSARAARAAEDAERVLARLRRLAERYTRLRVAAQVLNVEIERYRSENQDPLLSIASGLFARLTRRAFVGLRADVGDQGQPILVGVREDGSRLEVAGMSSGTRDQLYLALRLASLEWRLEQHEAMPFIVDDILINFDDERSQATLEALAELARRNQVILFTHHRQVVDAARRLGEESLVCVHELSD